MLSRTITARGAGCSSRGWSSDCKPATQTTPNAPAIRHASASLRPHTAHPATRRMQILVDRNEPGPLRRAHAPRATPASRHYETPQDQTRKIDGFAPRTISPPSLGQSSSSNRASFAWLFLGLGHSFCTRGGHWVIGPMTPPWYYTK